MANLKPERRTRFPSAKARQGKPWSVTILRAVNPDGSVLWPDHTDVQEYRDLLASGGEALFNAIWMQDPSGLAGEVYNPAWFKHYVHAGYVDRDLGWSAQKLLDEEIVHRIGPDFRGMLSFQIHDLAISEKETADFYARTNGFAARNGEIYIESVIQARLNPLDMLQDIIDAHKRYKVAVIGVEEVAFQSFLSKLLQQISYLPVRPLKPAARDKVTRGRVAATWYQQGRVFHRYDMPGRLAFEAQLAAFGPRAAHDDMADTIGYMPDLLGNMPTAGLTELQKIAEEMRSQPQLGKREKLSAAFGSQRMGGFDRMK